LKPPPESSLSSGSEYCRPAHQTSHSDASTGIFSTTSRKKIGQNPVIGSV